MKKFKLLIILIVAGVLTSCDDYLDINENTNQATDVTPDLILPQALTATASALNGYNTYGMETGGYGANAGGYGGFAILRYSYTSNDFAGLWSTTYDNLEDYQFIINKTEGDAANIYYHAVAKIMKAHNFQLLVDVYNDIPYSEALKGAEILVPKYDEASDIYVTLAGLLDEAMAEINTGMSASVEPNAITSKDVVFKGDMTLWLKLANTLKLKLLIRARGKATFSNTALDPVGFLTTDALINPGYIARTVGKQNPQWETWVYTGAGSATSKAWMPGTFVMDYYNGYKLSDPGRGAAIYYKFPTTPSNWIGVEGEDVEASPEGSFWYSGTARTASTAGNARGTMKGPDAAFPLFTAAESYFLQAEAALVGGFGITDAKDHFEDGITASFKYLYMLPSGTVSGDPTTDAGAYIDNNATYIVQYDLATTPEQQLEAIITQKYIAMNFIHSHEGWNEYRRTGYPVVEPGDGHSTFASPTSISTRADDLPTRILYPSSEVQYNSANVPANIDPYSSLIFWAK